MTRHTDVVVVGASIAGCSTARLLAQQGAEVTLVAANVALPEPAGVRRTEGTRVGRNPARAASRGTGIWWHRT